MSTERNIFKEYPNPIFIETGSCIGNGIQMAIEAGFDHIHSIELLPHLHHICKKRFYSEPSVKLYQGDSSYILWEILKFINEPITFWLDGHYSGNIPFEGGEILTADNEDSVPPIVYELEQIGKHYIKTHTILIDDVRCFKHLDLESKVKSINPDYKIIYIDGTVPNDILVAQI